MGGKYRLGRKIGSGSFGDIYLGKFAIGTDVSFVSCTCHGLNHFLPLLGVYSLRKGQAWLCSLFVESAGVGFP